MPGRRPRSACSTGTNTRIRTLCSRGIPTADLDDRTLAFGKTRLHTSHQQEEPLRPTGKRIGPPPDRTIASGRKQAYNQNRFFLRHTEEGQSLYNGRPTTLNGSDPAGGRFLLYGTRQRVGHVVWLEHLCQAGYVGAAGRQDSWSAQISRWSKDGCVLRSNQSWIPDAQ